MLVTIVVDFKSLLLLFVFAFSSIFCRIWLQVLFHVSPCDLQNLMECTKQVEIEVITKLYIDR